MHPDGRSAKSVLRGEVEARLAGLSSEAREAASVEACALLERQAAWREARSILFFAPLPGELNVWPLLEEALRAGKVAGLPRFDAATGIYAACQVKDLSLDIAAGRFGIREPGASCAELALKRLDFVLAPGIAFDLHGRRLGRGRGYYDRLLAAVRGKACGVAFDQQIVREVPVEPHDSDVNCILTPTRWIEL